MRVNAPVNADRRSRSTERRGACRVRATRRWHERSGDRSRRWHRLHRQCRTTQFGRLGRIGRTQHDAGRQADLVVSRRPIRSASSRSFGLQSRAQNSRIGSDGERPERSKQALQRQRIGGDERNRPVTEGAANHGDFIGRRRSTVYGGGASLGPAVEAAAADTRGDRDAVRTGRIPKRQHAPARVAYNDQQSQQQRPRP